MMNKRIEDVLNKAYDALEMAKTGLEWYQSMCPETGSSCDDEAIAMINECLLELKIVSNQHLLEQK